MAGPQRIPDLPEVQAVLLTHSAQPTAAAERAGVSSNIIWLNYRLCWTAAQCAHEQLGGIRTKQTFTHFLTNNFLALCLPPVSVAEGRLKALEGLDSESRHTYIRNTHKHTRGRQMS